MKYGIDAPHAGEYFHPTALAELAFEAEQAGWDGFFISDSIGDNILIADPWIALSAIAMRTRRITIGTTVTPLPRRRPWKVARETVTLDHLSDGRLVLGVGIGSPASGEYERFGEDGDIKVRAKKLDESLDIISGLWTGERFEYAGEHFQLQETQFRPPCLQVPRIPVWVGGEWPNMAPFRRAAKWDGVYPIRHDETTLTPDNLQSILEYVSKYRTVDAPFDVIAQIGIAGDDKYRNLDLVASYEEIGLTWAIFTIRPETRAFEESLRRVKIGPPLP